MAAFLRFRVVLLFSVLGVLGWAAPAVQAPTSVARWDVFEVAVTGGPTDGNPFLEVRLAATFTDGHRTVEVPGFYDGDGVYRVRFLPETEGAWRFETTANRWELAHHRGAFTVKPPRAGVHGPVRVANTYHFAYADGTPYRQIGTTAYTWIHRDGPSVDETVKTLAASPFNKLRMTVFPQDCAAGKPQPPRFPYLGTPPHDWDYTRFNPAFFQELERRIAQLGEIGVEADLILFHPYGKMWRFDVMDRESDERYLRYVVARLAAYRNVWWSLANEYDFLRTKSEDDWDHYFQVVQQADPFAHLRSIHNGYNLYDYRKPWVTHASIQNGAAVEETGRAQLYRDAFRRPVVFDEVKYEGNNSRRWGNLSADEMVHRMWVGTVTGNYVGHSETFPDPKSPIDSTWLSYGGRLVGESAGRLAFLKTILESAPATGIDPIDKWQDTRVGGKAGEFYLIYFGHEQPTSWELSLYREGLTDGMRFSVEVLDVQAMTINRLDGEFVLKRRDQYMFGEANGRVIPLPGKPYQALRIRYLGDGKGKRADGVDAADT